MAGMSIENQDASYRDECAAAGVLHVYERLRSEGNNPGFAAMLALKTPPGSRSDREFLAGRGHNQQFETMGRASRNHILAQAKKAGININGKVFMSRLGKPSDPLAWVSDRHDLLKAAQVKRLGLSGSVNYTPPIVDEEYQTPIPLAPDLMQEMVSNRLATNPKLAEKVRNNPNLRKEIEQEVLHKHAPRWKVKEYEDGQKQQKKKKKVKTA